MRIYYKNSSGKILDLMEWPYKVKESELLGYEWSYTATENTGSKSGGSIQAIRKKIEKTNLKISVFAMSKQEYTEALEHFLEVTEEDILNSKPGRLYVDDYYYPCYIYGSKKTHWERMTTYLDNEMKLVSPYPLWCREHMQTFTMGGSKTNAELEADPYLYYPIMYPYKYSTPKDVGTLRNDHYAACDFKMIIYGPCENPAVHINGHLYEVKTTLLTGEYLLVDSRDNQVHKYSIDGRKENMFNQRNKESGLFEKMPAGQSTVIWNTAAFGFDVILFQERSEPAWKL